MDLQLNVVAQHSMADIHQTESTDPLVVEELLQELCLFGE